MKKLFLVLAFSMLATQAYAVDGVYAEGGIADRSIISKAAWASIYRVGATWDWNRSWLNDGNWHVTGFWDVSIAQWRGEKAGANNQTITDIGIMPVFRYAPKDQSGLTPYFEAGVAGLHLISHTYLYASRRFSTAFQFGHIIGFGLSFGSHHQFEIGYRFQHISNADIKLPNTGMDFDLLRLAYRF